MTKIASRHRWSGHPKCVARRATHHARPPSRRPGLQDTHEQGGLPCRAGLLSSSWTWGGAARRWPGRRTFPGARSRSGAGAEQCSGPVGRSGSPTRPDRLPHFSSTVVLARACSDVPVLPRGWKAKTESAADSIQTIRHVTPLTCSAWNDLERSALRCRGELLAELVLHDFAAAGSREGIDGFRTQRGLVGGELVPVKWASAPPRCSPTPTPRPPPRRPTPASSGPRCSSCPPTPRTSP